MAIPDARNFGSGQTRSIDPYCVNGDISLPKGIVYVMNSTLPEDAERQLLSG